MKNKINFKSISIVLLLFLSLFRLNIFSYNQFMYISIVLSLILIIISKPTLETIKENIIPIILSFIMFLSTYISKTNNIGFFNGICYGLQFLSLFLITSKLIKKEGVAETVKNYYFVSLLFVVVMDLCVLLGLEYDETRYQNLISYIFGNKFTLSYLHLQTFALMVASDNFNGNKKLYKYILYSILSISICLIANCLTGVAGILVFSLMIFLPLNDKIKDFLSKPISVFLALLMIEILLTISHSIVYSDLGQFIVNDILNKEVTLRGRFIIYDLLPSVISKKLIFGYGYNASIITELLGYGNAQNGLLQCMLDYGIIGTIIFLANWYKCINFKYNSKNWPLYCAIYAFIVCSLFEICFSLNFFIILCILLNIGLSQKKKSN